MLVTLIDRTAAGLAVARRHVEKSLRRMRPGILHVGRQSHRISLGERSSLDIEVVKRKLRPDAGIKHGLSLHRLTKGFLRGGDAACDERGECAAIDHGLPRTNRFRSQTCGDSLHNAADDDRRNGSLTKA